MGVLRARAIDGRIHFGYSLEEYARRGLLARIAQRAGVRLPPTTDVSRMKPLPVMLHRDNWVVRCPDCGAAAMVWLDQPLTMCAYCFNVKADGKWRRVAIPAERAQIEEVVAHRSFPHQRNWLPGETVAALRRENITNGDPIPAGKP